MFQNNFHKIGVVILAAGMGKRMQSTKLKVMHEINNRPMIDYVVSTVEKIGLNKPVVVVCEDDPSVQNFLGGRANYVVQKERLGTGHAVSMAESVLKNQVDHIVTLYGDMPFLKSESIQKLVERHLERNNTITLMTFLVENFEGENAAFNGFGRVVRREVDGHIEKVVEKKDATPEQLEIKELNPSYFCFKSDWLWQNLKNLKNDNVQKEYYLPDLLKLAIEQGEKISSIEITPSEAYGVNTKEDLRVANSINQ